MRSEELKLAQYGYADALKAIKRDGDNIAAARHHRGVACSDLSPDEYTKGWKRECDYMIRVYKGGGE